VEERSRERPSQTEGLRKAASLTEDRGLDAGERLGEEWRGRVLASLGQTGDQFSLELLPLLREPELKGICDLCSPTVKREAPLPPVSPPKAALSEEELEKKSKAIIEEYLHLNDMKVCSGRGLNDC
jgi:translation initiation factor 4G